MKIVLLISSLFIFNSFFYGQEMETGKLMLKLKESSRNVFSQKNSKEGKQVVSLLEKIQKVKVVQKFPNHQLKDKIKLSKEGQTLIDLSLIYQLNFDDDENVRKIVNSLKSSGLVEYAEPIYKMNVLTTSFNDSLISELYYLDNIKAFDAYDIEQGDTNVVIGISDTGIEYNNLDLDSNIHKNYNDPINGIDDDRDGYLDNFHGWDLANNDNNASWEGLAHGVHVAGTAGARGNNKIGIVGTGFKCRIMPLKICNVQKQLVNYYESIVYGADHGCSVINCSWGGEGYTQYGQDIVNYAIINANCLIVAAAGNNHNGGLYYPASYKNVLSVAASDGLDLKWYDPGGKGSNYNESVDISAPGRAILSTWEGNNFILSSGTSMASPLVAGCAGIVRSHFPKLSALQICELLKSTSDNIDAINLPAYTGKLGKGRVNLLRALTDTNKAAIVLEDYSITDRNDLIFLTGDTLNISATLKNYLKPTGNVVARLSSTSSYVKLINNNITYGSFNTLESKTNTTPFKVQLIGNIGKNAIVSFLLTITYGNDSTKERFNVKVNLNYISLDKNLITTTATSNGKIGYNDNFQEQGNGLIYKKNNLLFEAGLMIGTGVTQVSDNIRENPGAEIYNNDFSATNSIIKKLTWPYVADFETEALLNDNNVGANKLGINVRQNTYQWKDSLSSQFVVFSYTIINKSNNYYSSLYGGLFADWDILNPNFNRARWDEINTMMYAHSSQPTSPFVAIKNLTFHKKANYYALDIGQGGAGGLNISPVYATKDKYITLSTLREKAGQIAAGNDIAMIVSNGPFALAPNDSITIAFALLAADSLYELEVVARSAQVAYNNAFVGLEGKKLNHTHGFKLFPNPSNTSININYNEDLFYGKVSVLDISTKLIVSYELTKDSNNLIDISALEQGTYILRFSDSKGEIKGHSIFLKKP